MSKIKFYQAVAAMVGTIIGAGVLGIPYAIQKVGLVPGLILLVLLGIVSLTLNLMVAGIVLRTKERHQLSGYVEKYLGHRIKWIEICSMLFGGFSGLIAFIIGEGQVMQNLFGGAALGYSLLFWAAASFILFFGIKLVKRIELVTVITFLTIMAAVLFVGWPYIQTTNFSGGNLQNWLVPYGVLFFALSGAGSIVSMREILSRNEKLLLPAVIVGSLIPMAVYFLFAILAIGISGSGVTEVATIGLGQQVGSKIALLGNVFAFFTMGTCFLNIGLALRQMLEYDFKVPAVPAWAMVTLIPLAIFLYSAADFIGVIGLAGSITYGLSGILLILTYWRVRGAGNRVAEFKLPAFRLWGGLMLVIFLIGFLYTVLNLVK